MKLEKHSDLLHHSDWGTLVILDACRFDFFAKTVGDYFAGDLRPVDSQAKMTRLWYERHWMGNYPETSLISEHPVPFRTQHPFWKNFGQAILSGKVSDECYLQKFDDGIAPKWLDPTLAINDLSKAKEENRILLHLDQPHGPFRGEQGREFVKKLFGEDKSWSYKKVEEWGGRNGFEKIERYYEENLRYILDKIQEDFSSLRGKVILTSDHAEMIGERGLYRHPGNLNHPSQTIVPWFEVEKVRNKKENSNVQEPHPPRPFFGGD